jgi:hypothetical protein
MVCYTGTGVARTVSHNLTVTPEMIIVKERTSPTEGGAAGYWFVYHSGLSTPASGAVFLNSTDARNAASAWNSTAPTSTVFSLGTNYVDFDATKKYIAHLFATRAGVSKVGSYTGDGTSGKVIACGFSSSARFVMIKLTDSTGDWFVWDTARGIAAGNDPHFSLNATVAEVTTNDSIDSDSSGFIVNQVAATNINVNAATASFS